MAKIHTHYDNLKVSRGAPAEVIRAAYKALSQKYHPDKNPGDEKAARIMAILNSAYGILSDSARRKEHDEWIAAEEWEVEWLESTRSDDGHGKKHADGPQAWSPEHVEVPRRARFARKAKWSFALACCFAAGCVAGVLAGSQPRWMPGPLASALAAKPEVLPAAAAPLTAPGRVAAKSESDRWAIGTQAAVVKAMTVSHMTIPARSPDCESDLHTLVAPNGEAWPTESGDIPGYPIANKGDEVQLTIDNTANTSPVFVKVHDTERHVNVRHLYVAASERFEVSKLASGKYELRYQNIDAGGEASQCPGRKNRPLTQTATAAG